LISFFLWRMLYRFSAGVRTHLLELRFDD